MGIVKRKSFTLIELIVAVGIVGLVLPAVFSIIFSIMRQQLVLISYQEMKLQGDSAQRNIKNILQNRAAYVTANSSYDVTTNACSLLPAPTPTYAPDIYVVDREGHWIHLSFTGSKIASIAADIGVNKTYNLTSSDVTISNLDFGFSCYRINEFTPVTVSTKFTIQKSTVFKDISLPYSFNTRLRNY